MAKNPAFPLYAQDFLVDVSEWTAEEVGVYIRLLCTQWVNGDLSGDPNRLAISGGPEIGKVWPTIMRKFKRTEDGRMFNERLEEVREEKRFFLKNQSEAGKKGAAKRWGKNGDDNSDLNNNPNGDPNSESIAFIIEEEEEEEIEVEIEKGVKGEKKQKPKKRINPADNPGASQFTKCMDVYDRFIKDRTGAPAKIDAIQGKAMKEIVAYLSKLESVRDGENTEAEVLEVIFTNWNKLDQFNQGRLKLTDINSSMINIINQIKNGHKGNNSQRSDLTTAAEFFRAQKVAKD